MLNRRHFLHTLAYAAALSQTPALAEKPAKRRIPWRNWSGSQHCEPALRAAPENLEALQSLIHETSGTLRPVGAGHSFTALVPTDDTIISLSRMSGVVRHSADRLTATLRAGTRLGDIGAPLEALGQAMINMPDIDEQTLAGCMGTATHGTGTEFGCLSTFATEFQIVTPQAEVIECSADKNADIFKAAAVSLGALGVITEITLQNIAPYSIRHEMVWSDIEDIMANADSMADAHRNFEFYYIPFSGMGFTDAYTLTDEPPSATDQADQNEGAEQLKMARDLLNWFPALREMVLRAVGESMDDEIVVERSWRSFPNERNVRFNEMEYHLPRENALPALKEIRQQLESKHHEVFFPIEFRYVKADDLWLSPFFERDSCSIAVHRFFEEDFRPYFQTLEPIFKKYGGRPHWGKLNTQSAQELKQHYKHWDDFQSVRRRLDPQGRMLNPYLRSLFENGAA